MTVYNYDFIKPALAIGAHLARSGKEAASQTFKRGAPLVLSSGYLQMATSGAALDIVGFALEDGHNDSSAGTHDVSYVPTEECMSWVGVLSGASPHTLAQANLGTIYGLAANASGIWYVDADESSSAHKSVTVTELIGTVGSTDQLVKFTLNKLGSPYVD